MAVALTDSNLGMNMQVFVCEQLEDGRLPSFAKRAVNGEQVLQRTLYYGGVVDRLKGHGNFCFGFKSCTFDSL